MGLWLAAGVPSLPFNEWIYSWLNNLKRESKVQKEKSLQYYENHQIQPYSNSSNTLSSVAMSGHI